MVNFLCRLCRDGGRQWQGVHACLAVEGGPGLVGEGEAEGLGELPPVPGGLGARVAQGGQHRGAGEGHSVSAGEGYWLVLYTVLVRGVLAGTVHCSSEGGTHRYCTVYTAVYWGVLTENKNLNIV